jgi:hypothetical protein
MDHVEIRAIRGSLSRAAFARLLGVTSLTVLRWELPDDNKEARRPRAKMVDALQRLAVEGVGTRGPSVAIVDEEDDEDASEPVTVATSTDAVRSSSADAVADEQLVLPLLDQLCGERWQEAEDGLLSLLSSNGLATSAGRTLATLGLVQVQILARMDVRGALAVLVPILGEAERGGLPDSVAGRAHVMAAMVFGAPDSRVFELGRLNAHVARAQALLPPDADDLRIMSAISWIAGTRFWGSEATLHAYEASVSCLQRATSPLARLLSDGIGGLVATVRNDAPLAARLGGAALAAAESHGFWGLVMGILSDYAARSLRGPQGPEVVLEVAKRGRERARAAGLVPTEGFIRLLAAECEAFSRQARWDESQRSATEALALAKRGGLVRYSLTQTVARLCFLTERLSDLKELCESFEQEANGPHGAAARVQADYLGSVIANIEGKPLLSIELAERVCSAPELTPGLEYVIHGAFIEAIAGNVTVQRLPQADVLLRRFNQLLEQRPSIWHSLYCKRAESITMIKRGHFSEARQRLEASRATYLLLGDVVQAALDQGTLAMAAKAAGAPDAQQQVQNALAHLRELGVGTTLLERRAQTITAPADAVWREPTLPEKLAIALDRLGVAGLDAESFRKELTAVVASLFPGLPVLLGGPELTGLETTVEASTDDGQRLWFGVKGALDPEQRAALALLASFASHRASAAPVAFEHEASLDSVLPEFIAAASATRQLKSEILRLSHSSATILISGESGSGKEVVARAVHDLSPRARLPYVAFNCASVPRDLFESQLFGYRRGAFTGAVSDSPGVIRAADGGTLFLDEIGELPLEMQPKLLRFLENGEILPIGETKASRVDVRIVAATHRDLSRLVREGQFREDLFYRLNVIPLGVPPLRERKEDVTALARLFIGRLVDGDADAAPALGPDAVKALQRHSWPGNVRELRNVIERAMAYSPIPSVLSAEHLRIARA